MNGKRVGIALASLVGIAALATPSLALNEQFIPHLVYRTHNPPAFFFQAGLITDVTVSAESPP